MFWDKVSGVYDFFETVYNGKVYRGLGERVAREIEISDIVLECACGTGAISRYIAPKCRRLIATDFSEGMLRQTWKNCRKYNNIKIRRADMTQLKCPDNKFDKVVAGNVIHLLKDPHAALKELERVCKPGGRIIVPTYINASSGVNKKAVRLLELAGADFKRQFDMNSYRKFFEDAGYKNVSYFVVEGRMPCAVAVITKQDIYVDNYIVKFLIDPKPYFCIWHSDEKDVFWMEKDKILYFSEITELQNFCEQEKIQIDEKITTYDVDKLMNLLNESELEIDCNFYIDMWNIFHDCAYSVDQKFYGDKKKLIQIYDKLFYGLNLPVINTSGEKYIPEFSVSEKEEIAHVLKEGVSLLQEQFDCLS